MIQPKIESSELMRALSRINQEIREGLEHGFFEVTIRGEVVNDGKRRLIVTAGKSHRFHIPLNELEG